jgi:acylphosphatase
VRNLRDGRVEAVFEGTAVDVDAVVAWCRTGPSWASVTEVEAFEEDPTGESGFQIAR